MPIVSPVFSKSRLHVIGLFEKQFLAHQLSLSSGNVTAAAKASKMTRQNFQRLMKKYGLESSTFKK
jgi:DNA-binding NtrC family response regulator